ncbi:MAG: DUF3048 domain-containing protein [Lachnospiraceae bacterium]|nr:DUF3048 domain-containing protein [Lachnospiraceae bacterium]
MTRYPVYRFLISTVILLTFAGCRMQQPSVETVVPESGFLHETLQPLPSDSMDSTIRIVTEDDTLPPKQDMVRSPLTNEWVTPEVAEMRPIAVIVPNESSALPHYNLSKASILYEANVEGKMSRMMAVFEDWQNLVRIGNIRSARTYYAYWAFEWDAFLVHYGGPYYINELMAEETTENINGLADSAEAFYRSKDRPDPHNVYADGKTLLQSIKTQHYQLNYRGITDPQHFQFASKAQPNALTQYGSSAANATYIDLSGCYPLTRCYFEFNEEDGLYYRFQHLSGGIDEPHCDADGTQLSFKNILVQYIRQEVLDQKGYLALQCEDDTEDGWFFTNGKGIHVSWEKDSDYGATKFYDDAGNEILLNTGKTMICVVNETDSLTFR